MKWFFKSNREAGRHTDPLDPLRRRRFSPVQKPQMSPGRASPAHTSTETTPSVVTSGPQGSPAGVSVGFFCTAHIFGGGVGMMMGGLLLLCHTPCTLSKGGKAESREWESTARSVPVGVCPPFSSPTWLFTVRLIAGLKRVTALTQRQEPSQGSALLTVPPRPAHPHFPAQEAGSERPCGSPRVTQLRRAEVGAVLPATCHRVLCALEQGAHASLHTSGAIRKGGAASIQADVVLFREWVPCTASKKRQLNPAFRTIPAPGLSRG